MRLLILLAVALVSLFRAESYRPEPAANVARFVANDIGAVRADIQSVDEAGQNIEALLTGYRARALVGRSPGLR